MRAWAVAGCVGLLGVVGCASPGPPRAPSLQLPQAVRDLSVQREGDDVGIGFTVPQRTTDGLPIREASVTATVCRGVEGSACVAIGTLKDIRISLTKGASAAQRTVTWVDRLPAAETTGEPRLVAYRVELSNEEGRTAGWSDAAFTAGGTAPDRVEGLQASETRQGILLRWDPARGSDGDQVILRRKEVRGRAGAKKEPVWLESHAAAGGETLDASAADDTEYQYVAVRRRMEQIGGREIDVRSAESAPVEITWLNRFPPTAPAGLSAAPFAANGTFAIDLVWEPVLPAAGEPAVKEYLVTRQVVNASGAETGDVERLGAVAVPGFHDATAQQGVGYRYSVRAVSAKGVQGAVATVVVEP